MVEPQVLIPNIEIKPDRDALARHGLTVHDIGVTVELALGGEAVSRLNQGRFVFPIILRLNSDSRKSLHDLNNLYLKKDDGDLR